MLLPKLIKEDLSKLRGELLEVTGKDKEPGQPSHGCAFLSNCYSQVTGDSTGWNIFIPNHDTKQELAATLDYLSL